MADLKLLTNRLDGLPDGTAALRNCIRDLIALSALPVVWKNSGPREIGDVVAGALLGMVDCDLVCVSIRPAGDEAAIEISRSIDGTHPDLALAVSMALVDGSRIGIGHPTFASRTMEGPRTVGIGAFRIVSFPMGSGGDAVLVAASRRPDFPNEAERALLGVGASQAAIGLYRWNAEADQRRFVSLIENSPDFVGFASPAGVPQYLNPAGLALVGLDDLGQADIKSVLDFVAPHDRIRAHDEIWPLVIRRGRWRGELGFRHFRTGVTIPFLIDWFRIDEPRTGRLTNLAVVARDPTAHRQSEAKLRQLNELLENRVARRTAELAASNAKLVAESVEREQADARLHLLQSELYHAARLSAVGEMAAALAHELNQPLTAAAISFKAARRLLARGDPDRSDVAEVIGEGAEQILRAGEIIHRVRNFVVGDAERREESVAKLIREASALALTNARTLGVEVRFDLDPKASKLFVDRIQIQQVLVNLLRNALDAMGDSVSRELVVTTRLLDPGTVEVTVADTGAGIPED
ncbi:MAG: sensor histidine kinase, partial [Rhodospirillales bacterium]|nr:sensor histidine kinase [Rhodospirillales bacterium]